MERFINDERATYDLNKHRYLVSPLAVEKYLGKPLSEALNTDASANIDDIDYQYIEFASLILYTYIYTYTANKDATEYYISHPRFRDAIIDAEIQLIYSFLLNGKPLGLFYSEKPEELVNGITKQILMTNGLLNRSEIVGLPYNYKELRGVEY